MKKLITILFVLGVASLVFAGDAQWFECSSTLDGKSVSRDVCATDSFDASTKAGAAGMCGDVYGAGFQACANNTTCRKTHRACVP